MNISSKDVGAQRSQTRASRQEKPSAPHDIAGSNDKPGAKTKAQANPGNGQGHGSRQGNGHKAAKATATKTAAPLALPKSSRPRLKAGAPAGQARYDESLRYGEIHYVADPVVEPVPGTAKVKLELSSRTDPALAAQGESQAEAMNGNPWFPTPTPTALVYGAKLTEFEGFLSGLDNLRLEAKNMTEQKDRVRKELEALMKQRASYVQMVSNGNSDVIASAGMAICNPPTPAGVLPAPLNLRLEVTQVSGELLARWDTVSGVKSFALECAEVIAGQPLAWAEVSLGGKLSFLSRQLIAGKTYAYRVAAIGGATGSSAWSPVVSRMAA